jgi:hypothetical protein
MTSKSWRNAKFQRLSTSLSSIWWDCFFHFIIELKISSPVTSIGCYVMEALPLDDSDLDINILDGNWSYAFALRTFWLFRYLLAHKVFLPFGRSAIALLPRSPTPGQSLDRQTMTRNNQNVTSVTPNASKLYCAACKKKFSNDATFNAHLKSAKHIQNEKSAKKAPAQLANPKDSASKSNSLMILSRDIVLFTATWTESDGASNSGIAQAKVKLKQARNTISSRPSRAAIAMWNLAQGTLIDWVILDASVRLFWSHTIQSFTSLDGHEIRLKLWEIWSVC